MEHILLLGEPFPESVYFPKFRSNKSKDQLHPDLQSQPHSKMMGVWWITGSTHPNYKADQGGQESNSNQPNRHRIYALPDTNGIQAKVSLRHWSLGDVYGGGCGYDGGNVGGKSC